MLHKHYAIYLPNTFVRWGAGTIPSLQKRNRYKEVRIRKKYTNSGCLVCDQQKLVINEWQNFLLQSQFFLLFIKKFLKLVWFLLGQFFILSVFPFPQIHLPFSLWFPAWNSLTSSSQYRFCIPLSDVFTKPTLYFLAALHIFLLTSAPWIQFSFSSPSSLAISCIYSHKLYPSPIYFLLDQLAQQSPSPFPTSFRLFPLLFIHCLYTFIFHSLALFHIGTSLYLSPQQISALGPAKGSYFCHWCPAGASLVGERKENPSFWWWHASLISYVIT